MSQPNEKTDVVTEGDDDEAEFQKLFGNMKSSIGKNVDGVITAKELHKECPDNPDLLTVRVFRADLEAGRIDPKSHPAWEGRVIQ